MLHRQRIPRVGVVVRPDDVGAVPLQIERHWREQIPAERGRGR